MNNAEQRALDAIPVHPNKDLERVRQKQRRLFILGYEQAEQDLALTWEDVRTILDKENDILHECNDNAQQVIEVYPKREDYYGDILKRFNEQREKK